MEGMHYICQCPACKATAEDSRQEETRFQENNCLHALGLKSRLFSGEIEENGVERRKEAEKKTPWVGLKNHGPPTRQRTYELTITDLTYKVVQKKKRSFVETALLSSVSASARPSQLLAIMGPSGAGKSTFLDAIAGRIEPSSLSGSILVNGVPMTAEFRRMSSYVMQDDALFPMLTVRETLMFSARLRLPQSMTMEEKQTRVEDLLAVLGLAKCADTLVGNEIVRGVSGGERRRCSIGVDLIHDPGVLFLDEPTSGLDSTSALNVMEVLHTLASQDQRTVILTIHQPSFRIMSHFDSLLILARGRRVFHGKPDELYNFFGNLGLTVPEYVNPLEYALDLIEQYQDTPGGLDKLVTVQGRETVRGESSNNANFMGGSHLVTSPEYASSAWEELLTLCERDSKNMFRSRSLLMSRVIVMVVIGLTIGTLFFNVPISITGSNDRLAVCAFTVTLLCYNSMDALPIFLVQREIFVRETSRGAYRTWTFVLANFLVSLPIFLLLAVTLSICTYFLVDLQRTVEAYFFFVLMCFITLMTANAVVLMSSAMAPNYFAAHGIVAALYAFWFLFSGFFLVRKEIPIYWIWLHYFNIYKYPLENLLWNEYTPLKDACFSYAILPTPTIAGNDTSVQATTPIVYCETTGRQILQEKGLGKINPVWNIMIMLLFTAFFRFGFYYFLRRRTKSTRK